MRDAGLACLVGFDVTFSTLRCGLGKALICALCAYTVSSTDTGLRKEGMAAALSKEDSMTQKTSSTPSGEP